MRPIAALLPGESSGRRRQRLVALRLASLRGFLWAGPGKPGIDSAVVAAALFAVGPAVDPVFAAQIVVAGLAGFDSCSAVIGRFAADCSAIAGPVGFAAAVVAVAGLGPGFGSGLCRICFVVAVA